MGLCNGTCSPTREPAPVVRRVRPDRQFHNTNVNLRPRRARRSRGLIPAKAPCSGNFDLYILRPPTSARGCSRYFPVVCRRVTFLIVIRHTEHARRACTRVRAPLYRYWGVYPAPHYAIREKATSYANHAEARIKKKIIMS